jgi:hypothetical protein
MGASLATEITEDTEKRSGAIITLSKVGKKVLLVYLIELSLIS